MKKRAAQENLRTREREKVELRGSALKGEKPGTVVLINAVKLKISGPQVSNMVDAKIILAEPPSAYHHKYLSHVDSMF